MRGLKKAVKCSLIIYLVGVLSGIGVSEAIHNHTDVKTETIATATPLPTMTATPIPTPTPEPTNQLRSLGTYKLTAYCACSECCGKWANGITASGKTAKANHTIAADTSILPFGTEVYIDGQKYVVEDRGGAIKGKRIDIFFNSHAEANKYGVKNKEIFIGGRNEKGR